MLSFGSWALPSWGSDASATRVAVAGSAPVLHSWCIKKTLSGYRCNRLGISDE